MLLFICYSFSRYALSSNLARSSAFFFFSSFSWENWQNLVISCWKSLSFTLIFSYSSWKPTYFCLNSSFSASKASWISYILRRFSRSLVAGDTVSYWLKTGILPYFFILLLI